MNRRLFLGLAVGLAATPVVQEVPPRQTWTRTLHFLGDRRVDLAEFLAACRDRQRYYVLHSGEAFFP